MSAAAPSLEVANPGPVVTVASGKVPGFERRFYRPELDLLRFLAFVAVFFHHSLPGFELSHHSGIALQIIEVETCAKQSGSFGVCLFFVLSAYLITELLQRERDQAGQLRLGSFYRRRILRIWPLYFGFLAAAIILGSVIPGLRIEPSRILAFLFLAGNWYVSKVGCSANPIAPLWSISVEEQFYLAWPWIARLGKRFMLLCCGLMLPISWTSAFLISHFAANPARTMWVNSLVQFQFFAIGGALALFLNGRTPRIRGQYRVALVVTGMALWLVSATAFRIKDEVSTIPPLCAVMGYSTVGLGCLLLFLGFLGARVESSSRFVYLGKISYGLYVFHLAAIQFSWNVLTTSPIAGYTGSMGTGFARLLAVQVLSLLLTLIAAVVSYHFLESPFLRLKEKFTVVSSRAI